MGMKKKNVMDACTFQDKTVIEVWDKKQVWDFIKELSDEEQKQCFEIKDITIKPLTSSEIKEMAFDLLEAGYTGENLFGLSDKEKREILRDNVSLLNNTKDTYIDRLNLDKAETTQELRFSPSRASVVYHRHPEINI